MRPSLKDNHLMLRTLAIRERADGLRGLVLEAGEEFVELAHPEGLEEPLTS